FFFFFSSRRRHTRSLRDWSSDVCSSDLAHFGNRDPDGAGRELQLCNLGDLVGLHVRPQRDAPRATLLLHPRNVVLEDVEIDVQGDRKSVVYGKSVDRGGRRSSKREKI